MRIGFRRFVSLASRAVLVSVPSTTMLVAQPAADVALKRAQQVDGNDPLMAGAKVLCDAS